MSNRHEFEKSSSLSHCDYEDDCSRMEIGFTSGQVYHYENVPKEVYEALKAAKSPGKHFHTEIRTKHKGKKKD